MGGEVRMRIAIVDDERQDCATLSEMLAERLSQTAFIDVYDSGNHFLDSLQKRHLAKVSGYLKPQKDTFMLVAANRNTRSRIGIFILLG